MDGTQRQWNQQLDIPVTSAVNGFSEATASALTAIGIRIKEIRLARGMTLQTLSDASGLSPSMLSLVERGRASPSIGSLVVIASSLGVTMSDLVAGDETSEEKLVVRASEPKAIETAQHVIRRVLREDRSRGLSIAVNEYVPGTGNADQPISHDGFEFGFILEGRVTRHGRTEWPMSWRPGTSSPTARAGHIGFGITANPGFARFGSILSVTDATSAPRVGDAHVPRVGVPWPDYGLYTNDRPGTPPALNGLHEARTLRSPRPEDAR